jgi:hypothetical protein
MPVEAQFGDVAASQATVGHPPLAGRPVVIDTGNMAAVSILRKQFPLRERLSLKMIKQGSVERDETVLLLTLFASLNYVGTLIAPMFGVVGDRIGHRDLLAMMRARPMRCWRPR